MFRTVEVHDIIEDLFISNIKIKDEIYVQLERIVIQEEDGWDIILKDAEEGLDMGYVTNDPKNPGNIQIRIHPDFKDKFYHPPKNKFYIDFDDINIFALYKKFKVVRFE